jgi:Holliday junction DNA helicase RuvA
MITYIRGRLIEKQPPLLTLEAGSLGYEMQASMQTFYQLPPIGTELLLHTHFLVREEKQVLYAFIDPEERRLFRELLKINSVGPKAALAILSNVTVDELTRIITHHDISALQHIPGIGRKTAERLLVEMKNRLQYLLSPRVENDAPIKSNVLPANTVQQDAISALITLGYKPQLATQIIHRVYTADLTTEQLIRQALQEVMQK